MLDRLVHHSAQKSIGDLLVRLLNPASDNLFDDETVILSEVASIRDSFIFKIVSKLGPDAPGGLEDHLNAS